MIKGIPNGWEVVEFRCACEGEYFLSNAGKIERWVLGRKSDCVLPIIRKIEKPKQYRPFANAAEFEHHRDRWFCAKIKPDHFIKTSAYNEHRHWSGEKPDTWEKMFDEFVFDDGTPFGIEVTE